MTKTTRTLRATTITMAHGAGGKAMRDLIEDVFVGTFANKDLEQLEDQARFELADLMQSGAKLAFTTDSYVVDPVEFPAVILARWPSTARSMILRCQVQYPNTCPVA